MKEVVKTVATRQERREARRHAQAMNMREERDSDRDFEQRNRENTYDNIERIYELMKKGAILEEQARQLISALMHLWIPVPVWSRIRPSVPAARRSQHSASSSG
jgi:hypothetical protein